MLFAPVAYSTGVWASLLLVVLAQCMATAATPPQQDLARASLQISDAISKILSRWDVNQFPIFLRTAWMFSDSHKQMKDRFKLKVAASLAGHSESFVASFTGSSVTAGHDHLFVQSYPVLVGILLQPAFAAAGINLTTRNAAMGNNPCMPYDVCVGTFADENSDIVIWEQSYNCHPSSKGYLYEQFVRQAMLLPSKPLIAFSDSETPNWNTNNCINVSTDAPPLTPDQHAFLKASDSQNEIHIFSDLNKANERHWGRLIWDFMGRYKTAGIQTYLHKGYQTVQCKGPYVPQWKGRNVMWHPSVLGHELRAAHIAHTWLCILRDAVKEILQELALVDAPMQLDKLHSMHQELCTTMGHLSSCQKLNSSVSHDISAVQLAQPDTKWSPLLPDPVYKNNNLTDGMKCYTDYMPRPNNKMSLKARVISNNVLPPERPGIIPYVQGWTSITFEYIYMPHLVNKTSAAGYLDFKVILYGNNISKPLDIRITVNKSGKLYICDVPGIPPRMQINFHASLAISGLRLYLSPCPSSDQSLQFSMETATELCYFGNAVETDDRCIQTSETITPGDYIVRVVPHDLVYVTIGTLLVP